MDKNKKAYLATLSHVTIIGFSFMFVSIALQYAPPFDLLAYRFFFAFIFASIVILIKRKNGLSFKIEKNDYFHLASLTLFYPLLFFSFQTFGLQYSTSSEGGIIQAASPIITVILASIFLKEKTNKFQIAFVLLSVIGVIYITISNSIGPVEFSIKGTLLLFLSALSISLYNIFTRKIAPKYSYLIITYFMIFVGFVAFSILSLYTKLSNGEPLNYLQPLTNIKFLASILYLGIISSFVTALLSNYALSILEASKVSVFSNITPVISLLAVAFILKEKITTQHLIGFALIII